MGQWTWRRTGQWNSRTRSNNSRVLTIAISAALGLVLASCRSTREARGFDGQVELPALRASALFAPISSSASLRIRKLERRLAASTRLSDDAIAAGKLRIAALELSLGDPAAALAEVRALLERSNPHSSRAHALGGLVGGRALIALGRSADARSLLVESRKVSRDRSLSALIADEIAAIAPSPQANLHDSSQIEVVSRASWGARRPRVDRMEPMGRPTRITVHHSALWSSDSQAQAFKFARIFQRTHMQDRSWGDLGYHWLIDRQGRILEGREMRYQGAHAGNGASNRHNIGICLLGNFEPGRAERAQHPSNAQVASLEKLIHALARRWSIPPGQILTHQEVHPNGQAATACPGIWLSPVVAQIRTRMRQDLAYGTR